MRRAFGRIAPVTVTIGAAGPCSFQSGCGFMQLLQMPDLHQPGIVIATERSQCFMALLWWMFELGHD